MKKINLMMTVFFGMLGIAILIISLVAKKYWLLMVVCMCLMLSGVAWKDYKDERDADEKITKEKR